MIDESNIEIWWEAIKAKKMHKIEIKTGFLKEDARNSWGVKWFEIWVYVLINRLIDWHNENIVKTKLLIMNKYG